MRKLLIFILSAVILISYTGTAFAAEPAGQQMSIRQALKMAITNSSTLKASDLNIDQAKEDRDAASEALAGYTPTGQTTPEVEQAYNSLVQKNLNWMSAKKSYQSALDSVVMSVYQAYYNVLEAKASLDAAQQSLNYAELQYRGTVLKCQLGAASKWQLTQDSESYESAKQAYASAEKTLADFCQKFNQLVGLSDGSRPELTEQPVFSPLQVISLDSEISRVLDESPSVWKANNAVDQAKTALDIYSYSSAEAHTYKSTEISISIAEQNAQTEKESTIQALRSLYYNIKKAEDNRVSLVKKLSTAEESLRIANLKYQLGLISRIDLVSAESTLAQSKLNLLEADYQHVIQVMSFETPWASSGS